MKNINFIIFDLGGVLLNICYQKTIDEFKKLGIDDPSLFYSKESQIEIFNLLETGEISKYDFLNKVKKQCCNTSSHQIIFAWNAMILDLPKKRMNLLNNLKQRYQIFLLSNTNEIHLNKFQNLMGESEYKKFYNLFKKVYYSHEIGFRKPNPEAFLLILHENNLNVKEVLFIDDSLHHIEGAKKLGIHTYHLQDNEEITTLFPGIFQ